MNGKFKTESDELKHEIAKAHQLLSEILDDPRLIVRMNSDLILSIKHFIYTNKACKVR